MASIPIMKIAVCVKHVPTGQLRLPPDSRRLDRSGPGELNSVDRNAVEAALVLKEAQGGEVLVVTMGADAATESLRTALAMGADRATLVADAAAAGGDLLATAKVLAAVLRGEQADLVLFGQQSSDSGGAVLWAAVAELLRLPFVSQVASLSVDGSSITVERETEVGDETVRVEMPCVVSVSDAINEPRYTSLKGMMGAKKKPLAQLTLAEAGVDAAAAGAAGSGTEVLAVAAPTPRPNSRRIDDEVAAAQAIVDFLADRQLV